MSQTRFYSLSNERLLWLSPPENLELKNDEAHVWLARLDEEKAAESERVLSPDERDRARRFRFERHKKQFIAARGFLRIILGSYLDANPREIRFEYNKYGKPSIAGEPQSAIKFNLSHSDDFALYAVARNREIGVDLERIKQFSIDEAMLAQCLTPQENRCFKTLEITARNEFFFDCWTRKEAYLKARGNGLSLPANQIETLSSFELPANFVGGIQEARQSLVSFRKLPPIPDFAATLAIEGNNLRYKYFAL